MKRMKEGTSDGREDGTEEKRGRREWKKRREEETKGGETKLRESLKIFQPITEFTCDVCGLSD